jgi:hypothetical protein
MLADECFGLTRRVAVCARWKDEGGNQGPSTASAERANCVENCHYLPEQAARHRWYVTNTGPDSNCHVCADVYLYITTY